MFEPFNLPIPVTRDKQLVGIKLRAVLQKQRLSQALNVKEFAVLAGISYSIARDWFRAKGFPAFNGKVFWQDFVTWRHRQTGIESPTERSNNAENTLPSHNVSNLHLPAKARNLLSQA